MECINCGKKTHKFVRKEGVGKVYCCFYCFKEYEYFRQGFKHWKLMGDEYINFERCRKCGGELVDYDETKCAKCVREKHLRQKKVVERCRRILFARMPRSEKLKHYSKAHLRIIAKSLKIDVKYLSKDTLIKLILLYEKH